MTTQGDEQLAFNLPLGSSRTLAGVLNEMAEFAETVHDDELHMGAKDEDGQMNFCPGCAIKHRIRLVRKEFNIANLKHSGKVADYRQMKRA